MAPCNFRAMSNASALSALAAELGYPHAMLPSDLLEQVAHSAYALDVSPSDELLVGALQHFLEHDAFLESLPRK